MGKFYLCQYSRSVSASKDQDPLRKITDPEPIRPVTFNGYAQNEKESTKRDAKYTW